MKAVAAGDGVRPLRADPFEHADEIDAMGYQRWRAERMFVLVPAQAMVADFMKTFQEFPPRQKPESFTIDQVLEKLAPPTP
jgi:arylsulfatase